MTTKAQLRQTTETMRRSLDPRWIEAASGLVIENLRILNEFQSARTVALYHAIAGEVRLDGLFTECRALGKHTCIPVFNAGRNLYEMAEFTPETPCKTGNHGIQEPIAPTLVALEQIDLIVVPGVAFDPSGNRLGRGGGYYDRLLAGFQGFTAGVAFDFQILPRIPVDSHDVSVHCVATETGFI